MSIEKQQANQRKKRINKQPKQTLCELETTKSQRYTCIYHVTLCTLNRMFKCVGLFMYGYLVLESDKADSDNIQTVYHKLTDSMKVRSHA